MKPVGLARVLPGGNAALQWPLYAVAATRQIETALALSLPANLLMQRAGLAVARLAMALAPHAQTFWIACGGGNNGGDGLEAAVHLKRWGKSPIVTWLGQPDTCPADALAACQRAKAADVPFGAEAPAHFDFCIDALLGIGSTLGAGGSHRPMDGLMADWISRINNAGVPVLAVDLPSGLAADTGQTNDLCVRATHTLSLLTLKPGLFTAFGRDACGDIWFDDLNHSVTNLPYPYAGVAPNAWLTGSPAATQRSHASHKGSFGDVTVIGGAQGMVGAALLAARAALHAGAGRVYAGLLSAQALAVDSANPELMFRPAEQLDLRSTSVVLGCGGGDAGENGFSALIARALSQANRLVIDADALNAIAQDTQLQALLAQRCGQHHITVLTPHPLEAARLSGCTTADIQADRLRHAQGLALRFGCQVVLKGSGSVIAGPGLTPFINPTGNGRLATAGTGDVLAGMLGTALAQLVDEAPAQIVQMACAAAVYRHGQIADEWPSTSAFTASGLIGHL